MWEDRELLANEICPATSQSVFQLNELLQFILLEVGVPAGEQLCE